MRSPAADSVPERLRPPEASSIAARAVMQGNRPRDTWPEQAIRSGLHRAGLRFRKHVRPLPYLRCEADIVFPRRRVAVFVDGCFWHGCPLHGTMPGTNAQYWRAKIGRNVARDRRNDALLLAAGWTVVRAWEHQDVDAVVALVQQALKRPEGFEESESEVGQELRDGRVKLLMRDDGDKSREHTASRACLLPDYEPG